MVKMILVPVSNGIIMEIHNKTGRVYKKIENKIFENSNLKKSIKILEEISLKTNINMGNIYDEYIKIDTEYGDDFKITNDKEFEKINRKTLSLKKKLRIYDKMKEEYKANFVKL